MINVFAVDDDVSILELYKLFFEFKGFSIIDTARDGMEAIEKFKKFVYKPDVILMDYHMPYKNGLEATKSILEIDKTARIIIVSGDPTIKHEALASGAIFFEEKPFNLTQLSQNINFFKKQKQKAIKHQINKAKRGKGQI